MLVMRKRKIDEANRNVRAEAEVVGIKSDPDVECHTSCLLILLMLLQYTLFSLSHNFAQRRQGVATLNESTCA